MDKFIKQAEKEGISSQSIVDMIQRDIDYKNDIYKRIDAVRNRQIASLVLGSIMLVLMAIIVLQISHTIERMDDLIRALLYATKLM